MDATFDLNFEGVKDLTDKELEDILNGYSQPEIDSLRKIVLLSLAQENDNPSGFEAFYELVFGRPMPEHTKGWIEAAYESRNRKDKKGIVAEAFRGSTKTTVLTILFAAWRIGWEPHRCNLLVQVGDDIATDNSRAIANLIEYNIGFRATFPYVEPDKAQGWGAKGYFVYRTDMDYHAWQNSRADVKDPSFIGVGYKSHDIIGKHPDGLLVIDDINDEINTASERELAKVRKILTDTIFPTRVKDTWTIFVGTPWVENDIINFAKSTGQYIHCFTPAYKLVRGMEKPTWKEKYPLEELESIERDVGAIGFARMYRLDLTASKNKVFRYTLFPASEVEWNWVKVGGVDYAGTMDEFKNKVGVNDLFAMAYVAKLPGGGAVVFDGVIDHCTQGQAETYVNRAQEIFDAYWLYTVVEGDGKGEEFAQVLNRNPLTRFVPKKTEGQGKGKRLEKQMSPWLENGKIRISDADTPFLNELRHELDMYPNAQNDDCLDALYWALRGMPDVLVMKKDKGELPKPRGEEKKPSPFAAFGKR